RIRAVRLLVRARSTPAGSSLAAHSPCRSRGARPAMLNGCPSIAASPWPRGPSVTRRSPISPSTKSTSARPRRARCSSASSGPRSIPTSAAGAVGQIAGQLAKIAGCRAVGIAGGPEKARDLIELYGYDAAIDYKNDGVAEALRGERVDVYFDNVGGEISQAVHRRLNLGAR